MTAMQVSRDRSGALQVETNIPLGFDRRELRVVTSKCSRGISCVAQVVRISEDGRGYSFLMFGDYGKVLAQDKAARATEKTLRAMHAGALDGIAAVQEDAKRFYAAKGIA